MKVAEICLSFTLVFAKVASLDKYCGGWLNLDKFVKLANTKAWIPFDRNRRRRIGDVSLISRRHMEIVTVTIICKPGFQLILTLSMRPSNVPSDRRRRRHHSENFSI